MTGIIGSPYFLGTSTGLATPLSTQKQLLVLLKRSLGRANHLKLTNLLAFNRLAMAKFDLKVSLVMLFLHSRFLKIMSIFVTVNFFYFFNY